jgi:formylglycine-generating enzyme required for sulfatase activity
MSIDKFITGLRTVPLPSDDLQERVNREFLPGCETLDDVMSRLLSTGWFTPYQIKELWRGRGHDLVLGHYLIQDRVGAGGMGQVFKALNRSLPRVEAVKVIHDHLLQDQPELSERFRREVAALAQCQHENLVFVYQAGEIEGRHFLAMEYLEGTDLKRVLEGRGRLPVGQACEYILQTALGMQHYHERGLVHRDIKPANIMAIGDAQTVGLGRVKLLDMGLARLQAQSTITRHGGMGTAAYMSPEQARSSHHVDIRADIYSLGCTLYHLLTGSLPFPDTEAASQFFRHSNEQPKPVDELCFDVPAPLANLVDRMLAKSPGGRPQIPQEVADALRPFAQVATRAGESATTKVILDPTLPDVKATAPLVTVMGIELKRIAAGSFEMGSDKRRHRSDSADEEPRHEVRISRSFLMATRKITQAQFEKVLGRNPSHFSAGGGGKEKVVGLATTAFPVECVSFFDALEFCNKLSEEEGFRPYYQLSELQRDADGSVRLAQVEVQQDGTGYRLPSEAEWEYCARAGKTTRYWFGNDEGRLPEYAWFDGNSEGRTHPVGEKEANPWGLFDMGGLVYEWCEDVWHGSYKGAPDEGGAWLTGGEQGRRVVRGGSWFYEAGGCRPAYRFWYAPGDRSDCLGFRVSP